MNILYNFIFPETFLRFSSILLVFQNYIRSHYIFSFGK